MTLLNLSTKRTLVTLITVRDFEWKRTVEHTQFTYTRETDYRWLWFVLRVAREKT